LKNIEAPQKKTSHHSIQTWVMLDLLVAVSGTGFVWVQGSGFLVLSVNQKSWLQFFPARSGYFLVLSHCWRSWTVAAMVNLQTGEQRGEAVHLAHYISYLLQEGL